MPSARARWRLIQLILSWLWLVSGVVLTMLSAAGSLPLSALTLSIPLTVVSGVSVAYAARERVLRVRRGYWRATAAVMGVVAVWSTLTGEVPGWTGIESRCWGPGMESTMSIEGSGGVDEQPSSVSPGKGLSYDSSNFQVERYDLQPGVYTVAIDASGLQGETVTYGSRQVVVMPGFHAVLSCSALTGR